MAKRATNNAIRPSFPSKVSLGYGATYLLLAGLLYFATNTVLNDFEDVDSALAFYATYHRNPYNQLIHFVGVPIIVWTSTVIGAHVVVFPPPLGSAITISGPFIPPHFLNMGTLICCTYEWFYLSIDQVGAVLYAPFLYIFYATAIRWTRNDQRAAADMAKDKPVSWWGTGRLVKLSLLLNFLSWYMQIHPGHRILEGASPAVMTNLGGALTTAPLFAFYEGIWFVGLRSELQQKVLTLMEQYTVEFCKEGAPMRVCEEMNTEVVDRTENPSPSDDKEPQLDDVDTLEGLTSLLNDFVRTGQLDGVNTNGAAEKHIPNLVVSPDATTAHVIVPHVMQADHFIGYVWLVNADSGDVIDAKKFSSSGDETPSLSTVLDTSLQGTKVKAISYCNLHGFWETEVVSVQQEESDETMSAVENLMKIHLGAINTIGASEKHIPHLSVAATDETTATVSVTVPHGMQSDHYIEYVWIKDVDRDHVLSSIQFMIDEDSEQRPSLTVSKVPIGARVQAFSFCNLHGLWSGEEITV